MVQKITADYYHIRGRAGRNIYPARQNQMSVVTYDVVRGNGQQSQH